MQKILRYACDVVLFTTNRYFSFIEAVNLEQALTVQLSLNGNPTTHILAGLGHYRSSPPPESAVFKANPYLSRG